LSYKLDVTRTIIKVKTQLYFFHKITHHLQENNKITKSPMSSVIKTVNAGSFSPYLEKGFWVEQIH